MDCHYRKNIKSYHHPCLHTDYPPYLLRPVWNITPTHPTHSPQSSTAALTHNELSLPLSTSSISASSESDSGWSGLPWQLASFATPPHRDHPHHFHEDERDGPLAFAFAVSFFPSVVPAPARPGGGRLLLPPAVAELLRHAGLQPGRDLPLGQGATALL